MRRWLIRLHRYMGIGLGVVFVMWFATGITMMYARDMPRLTPDGRLARRSPVDLARVSLSPSEAARRAGFESPSRATLVSVLGRPAFRFGGARPVTVFADSGDLLEPLDSETTRALAAAFLSLPDDDLRLDGVVETPDQWTLLDRQELPLHKFTAADQPATAVYVSPRTGDVVLSTTRASRALAWVSAIPHWLYFAPLRTRGALWRNVVIGLSALATLAAILGLVLAVVQRRVLYAGLLGWHYMTGAIFGVFTVTWAMSGMLSMEPFSWSDGGATAEFVPAALAGGPLDLNAFPAHEPAEWAAALPAESIKEIQFARILGTSYYVVPRPERDALVLDAATLQRREAFPVESILARVRDGARAAIASSDMLTTYDAYYYDRDHAEPLPVLRVTFADPDATWIYIDPAASRVVASFTRRRRIERWVYHGLHSLDFPFWYDRRPLWDVGTIILLLGGLLLSAVGVALGARRIGRTIARRKPPDASLPIRP